VSARDEAASERAASGWWRLRLEAPAAALEAALDLLASPPCRGTWSRPAGSDAALEPPAHAATAYEIEAWFEAATLPPGLADALTGHGARLLDWSPAPDRDWLEDYRRSARPVLIGRFLLDPREPADALADGDPADGVERLLLPARSAFGTGSHETTRLMVEELLETEVDGRRVLDVGTGTGVLAFVAVGLGATWVVGLDVDPVAALLAAQNAALNRIPVALLAGGVDALDPSALFELVLVNVLPENLAGREPSIARHVAPGGELLVSGVLAERSAGIADRWASLGLEPVSARALGEWTLLRMRRR
jgi:ribosomal protein L11 methyltransferase